MANIPKKDVFAATKKWAIKGADLKAAMGEAKKAGFGKFAGGSTTKEKAARFFKGLQSKHLLKSHLPDGVATYAATGQRLVNEARSAKKMNADETLEQHMADKQAQLEKAGLKVEKHGGPQTRDELLTKVAPTNMALALDKGGMEAFGLGLPGEDTSTAGYKKGADASASAEHKTAGQKAAEQTGLAPAFSMPHHEAPQPRIALAPSVAPSSPVKAPEAPAVEPETKAESAPAAPAQEPGDASQAIDLPI